MGDEEIKEEIDTEKQEEEDKAYREEVAGQIWEDAEPAPEKEEDLSDVKEKNEEDVEEKLEPEKEPPDPWEGVNPALKETLENVNFRLKQTESRIGSIQNTMHAAKEAAVKVDDAPSEAEIKSASEDKETWEELKEDFPEWAETLETIIDKKVAGTDAKIIEQQGQFKEELEKVKSGFTAELEKRTLSFYHKGWEETIRSQDYQKWLTTQPEELRVLTNSPYAQDAVAVLDRFKESKKKTGKTPAEIAADRKTRLQKSKTLETTHKESPIKSEADMSDKELRGKIANDVWAD